MPNKEYYKRFWQYLLPELTKLDPWYSRFKSSSKAAGAKTGTPGIGLWFRLRAGYLQATVTIEKTGMPRIENFWNQLLVEKSYIDSMLPETPKWQDPSSDNYGRIGIKVYHRGWKYDDWWPDIVIPIKEIMDSYRDLILPAINTLADLETTYFYAIQILDQDGTEVNWMGGISFLPSIRLKQHQAHFSKKENWVLSLVDSIPFKTEKEARQFEADMLASEIRAPNRPGLSSELFITNPIEWARKTGCIK